jgi:DNA-binding NarL/FixJ family response regulator
MSTHLKSSPRGHGPRVLVVDDEPGTRALLRAMLEEDGIHVVGEAANGAEAVAATCEFDPDVVLMDHQMPGVSGIEATRRIKAGDPYVQVIILTIYDDAELLEGAEDAGAYCYLVKGCSFALIREMITRAWQLRCYAERVAERVQR